MQGTDWHWQSGEGTSVQIGYVNPNGQRCCGHRGVAGTDHGQLAYKVECTVCGYVYGVNGSDMHERRCPMHDGGAPGIAFWQDLRRERSVGGKPAQRFTALQGQYLAFIRAYTLVHRESPAEADMQRFFRVTPPAVHGMVLALASRGLVDRVPGKARSIRVLVPPQVLPPLEEPDRREEV